jgi:hypothetical protein
VHAVHRSSITSRSLKVFTSGSQCTVLQRRNSLLQYFSRQRTFDPGRELPPSPLTCSEQFTPRNSSGHTARRQACLGICSTVRREGEGQSSFSPLAFAITFVSTSSQYTPRKGFSCIFLLLISPAILLVAILYHCSRTAGQCAPWVFSLTPLMAFSGLDVAVRRIPVNNHVHQLHQP